MNTPAPNPTPDAIKRARQLGYAATMRFAVANNATTKEASTESKTAKVAGLVTAYGARLEKKAAKIGQVWDAIVATA